MSVASELHLTLRSMGFMQLLIAIVFLGAYSVACSTLFGGRGRARAAGVALTTAVAFAALTQPWVHGALMLAGAIAGLGLFSAMGWFLSAVLHPSLHQSGARTGGAEEFAEEAEIQPGFAAQAAPARTPRPTRIPAA